jgi:hypothetical protein
MKRSRRRFFSVVVVVGLATAMSGCDSGGTGTPGPPDKSSPVSGTTSAVEATRSIGTLTAPSGGWRSDGLVGLHLEGIASSADCCNRSRHA